MIRIGAGQCINTSVVTNARQSLKILNAVVIHLILIFFFEFLKFLVLLLLILTGYKVLELFAGNADAYIHTTLIKKWDICAGNALLKEMSSKMTTLSGESIGYEYQSDPKNDGGLLASIWDHDNFLKKLSSAKGV